MEPTVTLDYGDGRRITCTLAALDDVLRRNGRESVDAFHELAEQVSESRAALLVKMAASADGAGLLDVAGVADMLGVSVGTVYAYRSRDRAPLPAPAVTLGRSPLWRRDTIEAWKRSRPGRGAGGGRPRKARAE